MKPASVHATVASANTGTSGGSAAGGAWAPTSRSVAKNRRKMRYSVPIAISHGSAIRAAKRGKLSPLAAKASRLVRLETGSSSEAVFDRWVQANTCGLGRIPRRAAVANTTGVSSTIVASRLSTAVITDATANTQASSLRGCPAAARESKDPHARNSPSSSHSWARTSTAARKPMTGPSCPASARASLSEIAPVPMTTTAAGTATTASGQPHGRITAQASTARSMTADSASASEALTFRAFVGREASAPSTDPGRTPLTTCTGSSSDAELASLLPDPRHG